MGLDLYFLSTYNWCYLWETSAIHLSQVIANSRQSREEFVDSQRVDHFVSLEQRRDREHDQTPSVRVKTQHTGHSSRSHSRTESHVSHEQETQNLRLEIDYLHKTLCRRTHDRGNRTPPSSSGFEDSIYRPRSKTPPNESFSTSSCLDRVERHSKRHEDSSSLRAWEMMQ